MIERNVAGQSVLVFAFDPSDGTPVTGDAGNITAVISLDDGSLSATNDTNPAEINSTTAPGYYRFDLTQGETDAQYFDVFAVSANAQLITVGGRQFTVPAGFSTTAMRGTDNAFLAANAPANFADLAITASTGLVDLNDKTGFSISGSKTTLDALNDISTADINAQLDAALDTAIPETPTAGSINERVRALPATQAGQPGGLATYNDVAIFPIFTVTDSSPQASSFETNLSISDDDHIDQYVHWLPGATLHGHVGVITDSAETNGVLTFDTAWATAPTQGDQGIIIGHS